MSQKVEATLRFRLRDAVAPLHKDVEDRIVPYFSKKEPARYVSFLKKIYGLHLPIEKALERIDWAGSGVDFSARRRALLIETDLRDFGLSEGEIARLPLVRDLAPYGTIVEGLGALYVLEGSALGGRVILNQLGASLGIGPAFGGRFLSGHGPRGEPMWQSFVQALDRYGEADAEADTVISTAIETFRLFGDWFAN